MHGKKAYLACSLDIWTCSSDKCLTFGIAVSSTADLIFLLVSYTYVMMTHSALDKTRRKHVAHPKQLLGAVMSECNERIKDLLAGL